MKKLKAYFIFIIIVCVQHAHAQDTTYLAHQDTLSYTLQQAEDTFLARNLSLIAQKYSIDSARATVITARLYDNPEVSFSNAFYNSVTNRFFEPEESFQYSQLIKTAGKRNKAIGLARSGIDIATFQFYDLLRTLRFTLRNDFYNIYFLEQSSKLYQQEIASLKGLVPIFEQQEKKGFIAFKDVLRIKTQLYTLQAEYNDLQTNIDNIQSELKLLIRAKPTSFIVAVADSQKLNKSIFALSPYGMLLDSAIANRPDLKSAQAATLFSQNNLLLQKALAKPDVSLFVTYDRMGSYVKDFNAIGIALPLPFFNRNQGNIANAKIQIEVNKVGYEATLDKVQSDLATNYITAARADKLLQSFDPKFDTDQEHLIHEVFINFQKRNITMLEFLDFYESYKQNVLEMNKLRFNKMSALEQLNFAVGKVIFNQ